MSALKTLIIVTATLIVPKQKVHLLVLVKKVGKAMGGRASVSLHFCWSFLNPITQSECFMKLAQFPLSRIVL